MVRESVFVDGNVPENLIRASGTVDTTSGLWTQLTSTIITSGMTGYITDAIVTATSTANGTEYLYRVQDDGVDVLLRRGKIEGSMSLKTPIKVAASSTVDLDVMQWSGSTINFEGFLIGFEI